MLQSLGANSRAVRAPIVRGGQILAVLIFLGYISIPVAVLAKFLKV